MARISHIDELTADTDLPLPAIPPAYMEIISTAIVDAWQSLTDVHGADLLEMNEAGLNALMEARLNRKAREAGAFGQLVHAVARGKESLSYDGAHLEKRPDLSLYLTNSHPSFPLNVECKILDAAAAKTIALYCDNGIVRFLSGEYSWYSMEGMLLAYVRDGSLVGNTLTPHLEVSQGLTPDRYATSRLPALSGAVLCVSNHDRSFRYVGASAGKEPGPIALAHIWVPNVRRADAHLQQQTASTGADL